MLVEQRPEHNNIYQHLKGSQKQLKSKKLKKLYHYIENGSASAPEGIYKDLIKTTTIDEILTEVFNRHLRGESVPQNWKEDWIISIHKNYRSITVMQIM